MDIAWNEVSKNCPQMPFLQWFVFPTSDTLSQCNSVGFYIFEIITCATLHIQIHFIVNEQ